MLINMCKSKIHRATVTDANLNYEGSLTIDSKLMEAADILPFEKVQVLNINTGERAETYVIEGEPGSGTICCNGALARMVQIGDLVIIVAYALMSPEEAKQYVPKIVHVNQSNQILD
ncbi:MAG: aspartate 1-decarboxylase [candidate division KSB1 bacterium]|nr:aspartate 1-decarboxylase [candidate division KSB1 bacterium]MDZ7334802.1 aspartate 1-decarboxylase [candidate division KSB1 bacterium]MDZ7357601.1 aspartate 1-decarboxylase [candidate division KSB1 bacterium]MDZ7400799.1 aspartate 1-decarboxylase [candidate division KSB1 bacterium]